MPAITIYTKSWCPYCSAAKKLLNDKVCGVGGERVFIESEAYGRPGERDEVIEGVRRHVDRHPARHAAGHERRGGDGGGRGELCGRCRC